MDKLRAWRGSTRTRIGVAFALLAVLLFGAVGVTSARYARQQVAQDTGEALLQLASRMAFALDHDIDERWREIYNLSRFQPLLAGKLPSADWRLLVEQLQRSFPHYAWIGLAEPDGKVRAATGGLLEGASVAKRGWFIEASKAPFVGNVHEALLLASKLPPRRDGEPLRLVDVAAPLVDADGRLLGVLGAHLNLDWAEERRQAVMATVAPERQVDLMVFDAGGKPVLSTARDRQDRPQVDIAQLPAGRPEVLLWSDGRRYLTAAMRHPASRQHPDLGWVVVARQPEDTALAAAQALQDHIWLLGLAGAALFGLTAWWLAGRLTLPLRRVAARALALAPGNAAARTPHGDEVTQLSTALGELVTQLRQREQELLQLNQTLEDKVAQRTLALEQCNADLRSFSHSVSHDLKGPVGGIGAAVRLVMQRAGDALDPATTKTLNLVVAECDRVRALTDEMLALAMMEQHTLSPVLVSMSALVRTVVDDVRSQVAAGVTPGSLATQVHIGPLPDVPGDPVLLRQVWHNLIANAFKFSGRQPTPTVHIAAETGALAAASDVGYSVRDNGAGFDPERAAKLFGVFQRLHAHSEFPGTGIGLSIVKRIVVRHGGSISATGHRGAGATFTFTLPRHLLDTAGTSTPVRQTLGTDAPVT